MLPPKLDEHLYDGESLPCVGEAVTLAGPAGPLEAVTACPNAGLRMRGMAVICHPHPLYGGTFQNKVVHYLSRTFNELGLATVRFNFRGVGDSAGVYAGGKGEVDDLLAVLDWATAQRPGQELWLAGFSFGAYIALRAAPLRSIAQLVTVAPPVNFFQFADIVPPGCPWLLVQGDHDEVVPGAQVVEWANGMPQPPRTIVLPGVDHFFHGHLNELRMALLRALTDKAGPVRVQL